jgi:hypothetical protein
MTTLLPQAPPQRAPRRPFLATQRRDRWWLPPLLTLLVLSTFVVYSTWAAFQGEHYHFGSYLSPFYSPEIFGDSPHAWWPRPRWWPNALPFSPALLILWAPAGFRFTCYYYRGAYYKAFWADPPACAVGEPRKSYLGEHRLPLLLQNLHRFFLYLAVLFIVFLAHDAYKALWFADEGGVERLGLGVGTLVLTLNVVLLAGYTFGCHSMRHLVGGCMDCVSQSPGRKKAYDLASALNRRHMLWAWTSLCSVMLADVYVRLCSMGILQDFRIA